ncbi:hypothetical protein BZM27_12665 [Paraburkholderia steynii]|uniref:Minor tail T domain-containing protein n=1 Tax=Paraburkholderia steynii TaxID=1245441 RepID=A0A4R0XK08_9BURK|nr:hypothetical protein BZM27_12665 [Paraburkholderia steynii]
MRAGIIASAVANHGSRTLKEPYRPRDFMPFVLRDEEPEKPILHKDPEQQSALILRGVFNREAA